MINIQKYSLRVVKEKGGRYDLKRKIRNLENVKDVFIEVLDLDKRAEEVFAIITLDSKAQITGVFEVSIGTLSSSLVSPREVFKRAILQNASAILVGHNHPSFVPEPSSDDIKITKILVKAGKIIGIKVIDHIIVGSKDNYVSMQERGFI
ncbi:JAB domain-containing protein [Halanaerobium praevalens]|jgi:DNA repair protein RadC|uniref:DNA repair protein RadC n=1 Tax=Halanaerobium praevalens (strain ATCC 33744 / DSM 2228 / GSL) TaxID=572479 RepID=E3DRU8_HALPG|nr:JAB domain-containing protein [Halanaerobium praevalens]ADO78162.1 DNA repair protein RadC [Halanaerobium praevalens DSM 2228]